MKHARVEAERVLKAIAVYGYDPTTGLFFPIRAPSDLKSAEIDHASSGDNEIVAAKVGQSIHVYAILLVVTAAVNCEFRSGTTPLSGQMNFNAKAEGFAMSVAPPYYLFKTKSGEALNLNLSGGVDIDGFVSYWFS